MSGAVARAKGVLCPFVSFQNVIACFSQRNNAQVIADSLINLKEKGLRSMPVDDPHVSSELRRQGAELEPSPGARPEQPQGKKRPEQPQEGAESEHPREEEEELKMTKKAKQEYQDDSEDDDDDDG